MSTPAERSPSPTSRPGDVDALRPAFVYAAQRDWENYFRAVDRSKPRDTLLLALTKFDEDGILRHGLRHAVDLGAGEGRDTAELLRRSWRVTAIDAHPRSADLIRTRTDYPPDAALTIVQAPMELADFPECDLFNCSFTLPFCRPDRFEDVWTRLARAIRPGGRFAGQLFGDRDSWATIPDRTHHTLQQARALLGRAGLVPEHFREDESDACDAEGHAKHWHVFHIVARKV